MSLIDQLTKRQQLVYEFIHGKIVHRGYGPTVREIGEHFGISSPNGVMCHLRALEKKGLIVRRPNKSRAIELVDRNLLDRQHDSLGKGDHRESSADSSGPAVMGPAVLGPAGVSAEHGLPLAGQVAAGMTTLAFELNDRIDFNDWFDAPDVFALTVKGDSMIEAQIADGDVVVVRRASTADPGSMVVAQTEDGEATLKYWHPEPERQRIRLQPANASMQPIYVTQATVIAVVVGVMRRL